MSKAALAAWILLLYISACTQNIEQQLVASRDVTQQLASKLKSKLKSSLQTGGPIEAVTVCNLDAKNIASEVSKDIGWQVGRTSLKTRNPSNAPDNWEQDMLHYFEQQKQSGADISNLEAYEITEDENGKWFRYMKAIPTAEVCLVCHGEALAPPVQEKLLALYPDDKAIGYKVGDIRGAFTVRINM